MDISQNIDHTPMIQEVPSSARMHNSQTQTHTEANAALLLFKGGWRAVTQEVPHPAVLSLPVCPRSPAHTLAQPLDVRRGSVTLPRVRKGLFLPLPVFKEVPLKVSPSLPVSTGSPTFILAPTVNALTSPTNFSRVRESIHIQGREGPG